MIKHILLILGVVISLFSCGGDKAYQIEGKIDNLEDQVLYAIFENEEVKLVDTIVCEKPGEFLLERRDGDFREVTIFFEDKIHWITAYLEKGEKITITGDASYPALLKVKGGRINSQLSAMRKEMAPLLKERTDLIHQLANKQKINVNTSIEEADVVSRLANVNHQLCELAVTLIKKNPDKEASAVLLQFFFNRPDDTRQLDELLAVLSPNLNDFYIVKRMKEYSARAKRTALGAEAPDFQVENIYGTPISLDSFPNQYLLLAFTAPWCDMCQTEDLYLDEVAQKYSKEKLELLLVSLDDNQAAVRKVLAADSIHWNLVTDSAGQAARLVDLYNVNALPRCFLIDEEGKIILKTDNGVEIQQTLEKLIH